MATSQLTERAKRGHAASIAALLNATLQDHALSVSVDREDNRIIIGVYGEAAPPAQRHIVPTIAQWLRQLEPELIETVRLFGYQQGNLVPVWSDRINLSEAPGKNETSPQSATPGDVTGIDRFIICGLGNLGQYCIVNLQKFATNEFDIDITAIDKVMPDDWEADDLPEPLIDHLILGNCCRDEILIQAGIEQCRTILIVTSNESDNIETAIAARRLNPDVRLVVRSSRHNLNQLLKEQLGNFVALEPTELPANTFALAALGDDTLGLFHLGNRCFRVVQTVVKPGDYRFDNFPAHLLHRRTHRLLTCINGAFDPHQSAWPTVRFISRAFYHWQPDARIQAGDAIAYVELMDTPVTALKSTPDQQSRTWLGFWRGALPFFKIGIGQQVSRLFQWIQAQRTRLIISIGLVTAVILWLLGATLLRTTVPGLTWQKAISLGVILLLGGYGDIFGGLEVEPIPWWVQAVCLMITVISLLFVLGVLGLIAENILSSRFEFFYRRPPAPKGGHVVLVGLGRIGQRIATFLQEFNQPLIAITERLDVPDLIRRIPVLVGNPIAELAKANLATAKSIVLVTDDQMMNLEAALIARNLVTQQGKAQLIPVIRTYDQRFSNNLMQLMPEARAFCAFELSAEAFTGAAFGENMLSLFRLDHQTILVAEYRVSEEDTLIGKLLAEVSYGYGVVPIYYQKGGQFFGEETTEFFLPSDDLRLSKGDRLIVLSSINGLRRIERGERLRPRRWRLTAQKPLNQSFIHYSGNDLARISGCGLDAARHFMETLPGSINLSLYDYQAYHLNQELGKSLRLELVPLTDTDEVDQAS